MGVDSVNPLEELQRIDGQINQTGELSELKPLFARVNDIAQESPGDFDVQFLASEVKDRLMARGKLLKRDASTPPAPAPAVPVETVALPPMKPPPPRRTLVTRDVVKLLAAVLGASLLVAFLLVLGIQRLIRRPSVPAQTEIASNPVGATIVVTSTQPKTTFRPTGCKANCRLTLPPGAYQVTATLDGFEPAAATVTLVKDQPAAINFTLQPQAQTVRVFTDLDQGKVTVDDQPPADLQDGQFVLDKAAPGAHTVKVAGKTLEASFTFELAPARLPVASGVSARNAIAVLVASFGKQARVTSSAGPLKLFVNGQPQPDAGPGGADVTGFQPGVDEILVGEGKEQHNMSEAFPAAPMLTAFLKTDVDAGTLIVSTGQDDVRVFLNDKEYRRRTQRGQLRIQTLGKLTVRAVKAGFLDAPPQTVEVKKGAEVRLQFDLKPQPQFGSLSIRGAAAGAEVWIDQKNMGAIGPDGSFTDSAVPPGDRIIELRRDKYVPKKVQRTFQAGQSVVLTGADVALTAAVGTIRLIRNPSTAAVAYRRAGSGEAHEARGDLIELPPGTYTFSAALPGYAGASVNVPLGAGETREVEFRLARERATAPPPPVTGAMSEFEDAKDWRQEDGTWVRKGGGFVPYKLGPRGTYTFTVELLKGGGIFRPGAVRWCVQYLDSKNYLLYELDRKNFWAGVVEKGKRYERVKTPHNLGQQKAFTVQIEVAPDRLVHKMRVGGEWQVLDTFTEPGRDFTQGKFGFLVQGNDEIGIADFKFVGK